MRYVNNTWRARGVLLSRSCLMSPVCTTVYNKSKLAVTRLTGSLYSCLNVTNRSSPQGVIL